MNIFSQCTINLIIQSSIYSDQVSRVVHSLRIVNMQFCCLCGAKQNWRNVSQQICIIETIKSIYTCKLEDGSNNYMHAIILRRGKDIEEHNII